MSESEDKIRLDLFALLQVVNNSIEMQKLRCLEFLSQVLNINVIASCSPKALICSIVLAEYSSYQRPKGCKEILSSF